MCRISGGSETTRDQPRLASGFATKSSGAAISCLSPIMLLRDEDCSSTTTATARENRGRHVEAVRDPARLVARLHARRRPALPGDRARPGSRVPLHRQGQSGGGHHATAPRSWASATSVRSPASRSWKARRPLQAVRRHRRVRHRAERAKIPTRSSASSRRSSRRSAASTSRTSRRPSASRSRKRCAAR